MIAVPATNERLAVLCHYMYRKTGVTFDPQLCAGFAVKNDSGEVVAAVILSNFRTTDIEISCASETSMAWRPHVCRAVFEYIFNQLGCVRCTSITTKANRRSRGFLKHLGFELEGKIRLGYGGRKDALIYGLIREECRFIGGLGGEKIESKSTSGTGPGSDR